MCKFICTFAANFVRTEMIKENFIQTISNSLINNWDKPAFTDYDTDKTTTYGQVAEQIAYLHLLLRIADIRQGDKISLIGKNDSNWVTTYLAVVTYGAIIVPILQDFHPTNTLHIINDSGSRLLFCSPNQYESLDIHEMTNVMAIVSLTDFHPFIAAHGLDMRLLFRENILANFKQQYPRPFSATDVHYIHRENICLASINYTSGTTGFSKGVLTTLNALAGNVKLCSSRHVIHPQSRQLVFLPLAHSFGCAFDFLTTFCVGAHAWYIGKTPAPRTLLEAFSKVKPTCIFTVPLILEKLYKKYILPLNDSKSADELRAMLISAFGGEVEEVIVGGAPLDEEIGKFLSGIQFPYSVGYGMTECAPLIAYSRANEYKLGSCGKALDGLMEIRIDEPDRDGVGEIVVRGEHTTLGYYHAPAASLELFTNDGWLRTGDMGYLDEEGYLFIKGRCKTMLLGPSGQNIYPEAIEAKLNNLPYVLESLVLQRDNGLIALVYPDYKMADEQRIGHEELLSVMEQNRHLLNLTLARYEQIQRIILYPHEFEKTPKKNIKRFLYTQMH